MDANLVTKLRDAAAAQERAMQRTMTTTKGSAARTSAVEGEARSAVFLVIAARNLLAALDAEVMP